MVTVSNDNEIIFNNLKRIKRKHVRWAEFIISDIPKNSVSKWDRGKIPFVPKNFRNSVYSIKSGFIMISREGISFIKQFLEYVKIEGLR